MAEVIIRYRLRPAEVVDNIALPGAFFGELQDRRPPGLAHDVYVAEDGASFVHVVQSATGPDALADLEGCRRLRGSLAARCAEQPVMVGVIPVGRYRETGE